MKAWFRALAAAFGSPAPAQTVAGLAMLLLVLYTGYSIPQPTMIGALRWITYINVSEVESSLRIFALISVMFRHAALALRLRVYDGQRVPYDPCRVLIARASRPCIREHHAREPGLHDCRVRHRLCDGLWR